MKRITKKEYRKLCEARKWNYPDSHSAYDLNEVGGFAHDKRIKK